MAITSILESFNGRLNLKEVVFDLTILLLKFLKIGKNSLEKERFGLIG